MTPLLKFCPSLEGMAGAWVPQPKQWSIPEKSRLMVFSGIFPLEDKSPELKESGKPPDSLESFFFAQGLAVLATGLEDQPDVSLVASAGPRS